MRSRVITCLLLAVLLAGCDAAPDPAARLKQVYAERPVVADPDNAFLDAFGFLGPAEVDPHELGLQRVAWCKKFRADPKTAGADPGEIQLNPETSYSQELNQIEIACGANVARACSGALDRVKADTPLSKLEPLLLARYEMLVARRGFMDLGSDTPSVPLPPYQGVIDAQRLMLIRLADKARAGDVETVRATLSRDLIYWRRMFASSDSLLSKMVALAGIRQHFKFGSHVLKNLPADRVMDAVPSEWHAEFSTEELSMLRVFSSELMFVDEVLRDDKKKELLGPKSGQISLEGTASYLLAAAEAYRPPLSGYLASTQKLRDDYWQVIDSRKDMSPHAIRAGSAEAMRRAALLAVTLRSQGVPLSQVAAKLEQSASRNPFDGKSFIWDAADQAVVFIMPNSEKNPRRAYPY